MFQHLWLIDFHFEPTNCANQASDTLSPFPQVRRPCLKYLYSICGRYDLPPTSIQVEIELLNRPVDGLFPRGGFGDVFKCMYHDLEVAVKVLRIYPTCDPRKTARVSYCRPSIFLYMLTDLTCAEVLQGGHRMEIPSSSKFSAISWSPEGQNSV
jgi:hypothetical protein